jgi:hypothetical protein
LIGARKASFSRSQVLSFGALPNIGRIYRHGFMFVKNFQLILACCINALSGNDLACYRDAVMAGSAGSNPNLGREKSSCVDQTGGTT